VTVFLLEYEPATGTLLSLETYDVTRRHVAQDERLRREKENASARRDREVVLLEAVSEAGLRSTHSRYFKTLEELTKTAAVA
jgi:hypothetical protein